MITAWQVSMPSEQPRGSRLQLGTAKFSTTSVFCLQVSHSQRVRKTVLPTEGEQDHDLQVKGKGFKVVDLKHMTRSTRQLVVDRALNTTDQDNESFLQKFQDRVAKCAHFSCASSSR